MHGKPTKRKRPAESWPQKTPHAQQNPPSQGLIAFGHAAPAINSKLRKLNQFG